MLKNVKLPLLHRFVSNSDVEGEPNAKKTRIGWGIEEFEHTRFRIPVVLQEGVALVTRRLHSPLQVAGIYTATACLFALSHISIK